MLKTVNRLVGLFLFFVVYFGLVIFFLLITRLFRSFTLFLHFSMFIRNFLVFKVGVSRATLYHRCFIVGLNRVPSLRLGSTGVRFTGIRRITFFVAGLGSFLFNLVSRPLGIYGSNLYLVFRHRSVLRGSLREGLGFLRLGVPLSFILSPSR